MNLPFLHHLHPWLLCSVFTYRTGSIKAVNVLNMYFEVGSSQVWVPTGLWSHGKRRRSFFSIFGVLPSLHDPKAQTISIFMSSTTGSWKVQVRLLSLIIREGDFALGISDTMSMWGLDWLFALSCNKMLQLRHNCVSKSNFGTQHNSKYVFHHGL